MKRLSITTLIALSFVWFGACQRCAAQQIIGRPMLPLSFGCPTLQSGLVAYYKWETNDTGNPSGVVDANGATNNLTWSSPFTTNYVYFTPAKVNYGVELYPVIDNNGATANTGADDATSHHFNFPTSSFSIGGWIRIRIFDGASKWVLQQGTGGTDQQYAVALVGATKKLQFYVRQSNGTDVAITDSQTLVTNQWYFFAARYTNNGGSVAGNLKLWVDTNTTTGNTVAADSTLKDPSTDKLRIGALVATSLGHWLGAWDEIGFWNRAITDDEVTCLYNSANGRTYPLSN